MAYGHYINVKLLNITRIIILVKQKYIFLKLPWIANYFLMI